MIDRNILSNRLLVIKNMIKRCDTICDIGTDHALLPIALLNDGSVKKAYAFDVRQGPLQKAYDNIKKYDNVILDKNIIVRQSNGFDELRLSEHIDVAIIAGMGGELIAEILTNAKNKLNNIDTLLVSPHTFHDETRKKLAQLNYIIVNEDAIYDQEKYYVFIEAIKTDDNIIINYTDEEWLYGPILLKNKNKYTQKYIKTNVDYYSKLLLKMEDVKEKRAIERKNEVTRLYSLAKNTLNIMENL